MWQSRPSDMRLGTRPSEIESVSGPIRRGRSNYAPPVPQAVTADLAEASWLDMTDAEKLQFLKLAKQGGLISGKVTPADLAAAWSKATSLAAAYNQTADHTKWVSPWEAVTRLAMRDAAANGAAFDGLSDGNDPTHTVQQSSRVRKYTTQQLATSARDILRQELGRAPNEQELGAFTLAVNKAAEASPETVTTTTDTDGLGNSTSSSSSSGGIDPQAIITDQAKRNPEYAKFQGGATYFQAAMAALDAVTR